jgi:GT2 family glycosyltransferase
VTRVRVVVLNYDGGDHVQRALDALARLDWDGDLDVVVIDNASTDGSADVVAAAHPEVRLVRNPDNLGFGANNEALADLDGVDYVALLNNDAFVEPGWLDPLVDALGEDDGLGAVQSKILLEPRFVDVRIETVASTRRLDPRRFGVQVRGLRTAGGRDLWPRAHLASGGHGPELDGESVAEWTSEEAVLRVPVDADDVEPPSAVEVLLAADEPKRVRLSGEIDEPDVEVGVQAEVGVEVGPAARWVTVALAGDPFDVINSTGGQVADDGSASDRGYLEADRGQYDDRLELDAWSGGSVLLRPAYLADVGLLDPRYFLYYEDTDLSWRGRARGWRYRYVPESVVRHVHAAGSGDASRLLRWHVERNRLLFLTKNAPAPMAARAVLRHPLSTLSYARRDVVGAWLDHRPPDPSTVRLRTSAYLSYLRAAPAMLADRRHHRR